jgi:hypothetical protein
MLSEKARISNAELITKTDLGPAEGGMGGNVSVFLLAGIMINGFCKYTKMNNKRKS